MSRVIKVDGPGKIRSQLMRTSAEMLKRLSQKKAIDDAAKDITALLVFCLREIAGGIDQSALAWEKRDYWVKAERFRARWAWSDKYADEISKLIYKQAWEELPLTLIQLIPYFEDIKVARFTRSPNMWRGAYQKFLKETPKHV